MPPRTPVEFDGEQFPSVAAFQAKYLREYRSWICMNNRCRYECVDRWDHYGGRGIRVCDQWVTPHGFRNFLRDMGRRPPGTTLDRVDLNGNYQPGNCRWATAAEQAANSGNARPICFRGETQPLAEWARRFGVHRHIIRKRLLRGLPLEKVFESNVAPKRFLTFQGKTMTVQEWGREVGLHGSTLRRRLNTLGWSVEKTLTTKRRDA